MVSFIYQSCAFVYVDINHLFICLFVYRVFVYLFQCLCLQVEQPFKIMPLWQLAHGAMDNIEGALSTPEVGVRAGDRVRAPVPNW